MHVYQRSNHISSLSSHSSHEIGSCARHRPAKTTSRISPRKTSTTVRRAESSRLSAALEGNPCHSRHANPIIGLGTSIILAPDRINAFSFDRPTGESFFPKTTSPSSSVISKESQSFFYSFSTRKPILAMESSSANKTDRSVVERHLSRSSKSMKIRLTLLPYFRRYKFGGKMN